MERLENYTILDELTEGEQEKIVREFLEGKFTVEFDEEHCSMVLVKK